MSRQGKGIALTRRRVRVSTANRRMAKNRPDITLPTPKSETVSPGKNHPLKVKSPEVIEPQVKVQIILPSSAPIQPPVAKKAKVVARQEKITAKQTEVNANTKQEKAAAKQNEVATKPDEAVARQEIVAAKPNTSFFDIKASKSPKESTKDAIPNTSRNVATFPKKTSASLTQTAAPQTSPTFIIPDTPKAKTSVSEAAPQPSTPKSSTSKSAPQTTAPKLATPKPATSATTPKPAISATTPKLATPATAIPKSSPEPLVSKVPAKTIKEEAIKKAVAATKSHFAGKKKRDPKELRAEQFGWQRLVLAFASSLVLVFAIIYFANLNAPDVSLKVAAMQTGINASYPAYTPRDFTLTDITSENGKITLNFKNLNTDVSYSLVEENSAWDTTALYNNFVKPTYIDDYTMIREQGLTIYISRNSNAVWVNGGVFYQLNVKSGSLTKKQITTIATSL